MESKRRDTVQVLAYAAGHRQEDTQHATKSIDTDRQIDNTPHQRLRSGPADLESVATVTVHRGSEVIAQMHAPRSTAAIEWVAASPRPARGRIRSSMPTPSHLVKCVIDLTLTIIGGLLVLPVMLGIALLIKLSSPGPVIFRQERVGLHGRRFLCWKFRTMVCNGDRVLEDYLTANPQCREEWNRNHKLQRDPRVTLIGRFLRMTSLDELPQLWNVLKRDMSIVGPRPILASEIPDFGKSFEDFSSVLPGITGLWQVSGRNRTTYAEHVALDAYYARNWSLWLDTVILLRTFKVVLLRDGAY